MTIEHEVSVVSHPLSKGRRGILLLLVTLVSSCSTISPRSYLEEETRAQFGVAPISLVSSEEFDRINQTTDFQTYLTELSALLSDKTIGDLVPWGGISLDAKVRVSRITQRILTNLSRDPVTADLVLEVYTRLNLRPTPGYVLGCLAGEYGTIDKVIAYVAPVASKIKIQRLIQTLPSLKASVLAIYIAKGSAHPDEKEARDLYNRITEENFEKLASHSKLFSFENMPPAFNERIGKGFSESVSHYRNLQEMLRRVSLELQKGEK